MVNVKCERTAFNLANASAREHCKWLFRINCRLGKIHWMRTLEFFVVNHWTTLVVCCLSGEIKCSSVTIATARLRSSF